MKIRAFAILFASVLLGLVLLNDLTLRKIYPRYPSLQPILSVSNALVDLAKVPAVIVARNAPAGPVRWAGAAVAFMVTHLLVGAGLCHAVRWMRRPGSSQTDAQPDARVESRRRFLKAGVGLGGTGLAAAAGYGMFIEPRNIEFSRRVIRLPNLLEELSGITVVQLTDLHHGPWVPASYLQSVVERVNALRPDLVLLTGDYVSTRTSSYIDPAMDVLASLRPTIGTLAVLGNHDWWSDGKHIRRRLEEAGVWMLDNTRCFLGSNRTLQALASRGLCIAGVGDLYQDRQDYQAALGGLPAAMPRLLLSHNPDVAEEKRFVASGLRADLMLCGHTHGGQVRIPLLGTPVVPSRYGQKYAAGLVRGPVCPVFICRGVGLSVLPVRMGVRPEVAILELRPGNG